jgi:hypothetical protein
MSEAANGHRDELPRWSVLANFLCSATVEAPDREAAMKRFQLGIVFDSFDEGISDFEIADAEILEAEVES